MTMRRAGLPGLVAVLLCAAALPAAGGVTGSPHDFTGRSFAPGGSCSACHRVHYAPETKGLWSRDLSQENGYFDQTSDPDYVPGGTLLCYDCHVDYTTGSSGASPDNDPPDSSWEAAARPQDIAFTDGPGSEVGYYELKDGSILGTPPPAGDPTGGHYWKGVSGDSPNGGYSIGDKLDCSICHDPHDEASGGNEVMLRSIVTDGTYSITVGFGLTSSSATRNWTTGDGRDMCAGCHGYSGDAPETLFGVTLPVPPDKTFDGHGSGDSNECTLCHPHNSPDCGGCHGNPPPLEAAGYNPGGIDEVCGPHPRHANEQSHPTDPGYEIDCTICHFSFPADHRNGSYQNVVFDAGKNPSPSRSSQRSWAWACPESTRSIAASSFFIARRILPIFI